MKLANILTEEATQLNEGIKHVAVHDEIFLSKAGKVVDEDSKEAWENIPRDKKGLQYDVAASVDHKEDPAAAVSEINDYLKENGVKLQFVLLDRGDDAYTFGVPRKQQIKVPKNQ